MAKIGRILVNGTAQWVAFFVSGKTYDSSLYPSIYILAIADGSVVQRVFLNVETEGVGGVHFKADPNRSDEQNYREGYNRVYDTLELEKNLDDSRRCAQCARKRNRRSATIECTWKNSSPSHATSRSK